MGVLERVNARVAKMGAPSRDMSLNVDQWSALFEFGGLTYPLIQTTMGNVKEERIVGSTIAAHHGNTAVFALVQARMQAFSQIRFQWTRFSGSQPGDLFGTPELGILERPWPGGKTCDLLARMELDNSIAGNAYIVRPRGDRLARLRPDLVTIILGSQLDPDYPMDAEDVEVAGYGYFPRSGKPKFFTPDEVCHYVSQPDPNFQFLGMSWLTPCIREVQADSLAVEHKARFFQNAACEPVDAQVLTPAGWTTMGEIKLGDRVIGSDGRPYRVSGVFPRGEDGVYRVTFTGGATVECTADHLWQVASYYDRKKGSSRTLRLDEIGVRYNSGPAKWSVPLVEPVQFDDPGVLPLPAYLMGALLGDGSFRSNGRNSGGVTFSADQRDADQMEDVIGALLPPGVVVSRRDRGSWAEFYFKAPDRRDNPLTTAVRLLGLWDVPGAEKYIPPLFLRAPVLDRVALLQGLLDTDGSVSTRQPNLVRFTSTSQRLSEQLADLVGGLGGIATVLRLNKTGGGPQWQVTIKRLPEWITPFRLRRKALHYEPPSDRAGRWRFIQSVEYVGRKQVKCIRVESPDSLYVTNGYILTHNTPNLAIKFDPTISIDMVRKFKALMEEEHKGAFNAYKTLYLGGGADPVTVGKDFQQLEFSATQGKGESRLAAAAGVPPSWVGFSEGLQGSSLNAGNFNSARRRFSDGTMYHLWMTAAASLESILAVPPGASLWFDNRVPFMREDAGDLAEIQASQAATITQLVREGFTPESVVAAVANNDMSLLKHSGLLSVQLQPPGTQQKLPSPVTVNGNGNTPAAIGGAG